MTTTPAPQTQPSVPAPPEDVLLETSGRPVSPDDEIKILDEDDNEVKPGDVGEFCVRGPYTLRGYYGVPEHNAQAFTTDGFYRSGDLMLGWGLYVPSI